MEKLVDGIPTGKAIVCFFPSRFYLPGGCADDVKRLFKATFGIELPSFDQRVGPAAAAKRLTSL
jgi:hypothetical protein